jgi:zinc transport system substrate-binding protein
LIIVFMSSRTAALLAFASLPLVSACSSVGTGGSGAGPDVVAAFYPFAYVAERVAGGHADVTNLTAPGLEPHDLELTPQQVAELSNADIVVYEQGFQPTVDDAVDQNPPDVALDVTEVVDLKDTGAPEAGHEEPSSGDHGDGAQTDAEHTDSDHGNGEGGHADDAHAKGDADLAGDPHLWQDPTLLVPIAERLASELSEADPDHADDYDANADQLIDDLTTLDDEIRAGLATCERREFVTSHAAFGYFANRYGLNMISIAGLSPDAEPSPAHIAELQDLIAERGITTVFSEVLGSKEYADSLADDLGLEARVLDPIEGLSDEDSDDDYLSLMRKNLRALQAANGCS